MLIPKLLLHVIRVRGRSLVLGPLELLRLGAPHESGDAVHWPIEGGLLTRRPAGELRIGWRDAVLFSTVDGYLPTLPRRVYSLSQLPFHHALTRLFLLHLRGRTPAPGIVAEPARRAMAAGVDAAACAAAATLIRRRRLGAAVLLTSAYLVTSWTFGGRTLGSRVLGMRVVSVDGSPVALPQAVIRLAWLPIAALRRRALHDEQAGTEVVIDERPRR